MSGTFKKNRNRPVSKLVQACTPEIVERTKVATEQVRPTVARSDEPGLHLQDSLRVEAMKWGARVYFGDPDNPEKAPMYEFGNGTARRPPHPVLGTIGQIIERS